MLTGVFMPVTAQNTAVGNRSPEQEATKQTEKYQKELKLTDDQVKLVYDINLKYARERKQSNNRTEAVSRIRKKNEEISRVLNQKQNYDLQNKRSETQSVEIDGKRNFTRTNGAVRVNENSSRTNNRSEVNSGNRPVRPTRTAPASRQSTTGRSDAVRENDRPVRVNSNGSSGRSSSSISTRERSSSSRETRSSNSAVRSSDNDRQSTSSGSRSENSSQPVRRESGSRR